MERTARSLGLTLQVFEVARIAGLDRALTMMAKTPPGALIVPASSLFGCPPKTGRRLRCYAIADHVMLKEGAAKFAAYAEGKVLGKVKGATEIAPS